MLPLKASECEKHGAILLRLARRDPSRLVRQNAIASLRFVAGLATIRVLIRTLQDASPVLRAEAAEALSYHPRQEIMLGPLLNAARDDHAEVRLFAAYTLGMHRFEEARGTLERLLADSTEVPTFGTVGDEARRMLAHLDEG